MDKQSKSMHSSQPRKIIRHKHCLYKLVHTNIIDDIPLESIVFNKDNHYA